MGSFAGAGKMSPSADHILARRTIPHMACGLTGEVSMNQAALFAVLWHLEERHLIREVDVGACSLRAEV